MIKLNFITSLSTANETNRRFTTKFTAGDESLPLTPDHEKVTKRIVPVASGRAFITCLSTAKQKKKQFTTKFTGGNESLRLTPDHGKVTERVVPVASGRAFREQQLKLQNQEPEKGCIIQLRALIVSEQAKHEARVEEYRANFRRGFRSDPEPKANLLRVLEIILEVREEDDFLEQIGAKPAHIEFSFSYLKTRHSFHLVDPSPWPLAASLGVFMLTTGSVLYMQKFIGGGSLLLTGLVLIIFVMFTWWRDIIREATFEEQHTFVVQRGLRLGMVLFIVSEIMFFFAFFWAFFHSSL